MSRRAGSIPKDTRANLIKAAAEEFHEFGYDKASLRRICAKAEVTTGAMYFFFNDKQDLFSSVIAPVTGGVLKIITKHFEWERSHVPISKEPEGFDGDVQAMGEILDAYFANRELFEIVLNNRDQKVVSEFFDVLIEVLEAQTRFFLKQNYSDEDDIMDSCMVHWFSHLQVDAVLHILSHDYSKEESKRQLAIMVKFLSGGFFSLMK